MAASIESRRKKRVLEAKRDKLMESIKRSKLALGSVRGELKAMRSTTKRGKR